MSLSVAAAEELLAELGPDQEGWPLHCRQVAKVADRLGQRLSERGLLDHEQRELLTVQALLHDIGRSRTHGPLHGWTGYTLLRSQGLAAEGRGCLSHWLKGRGVEEIEQSRLWTPAFAHHAWSQLHPPAWTLADSALSVADSSVQHSTIVPMADRHRDLYTRYGDSPWLRRAAELAEQQAEELGAALGCAVDALLQPLYGDCLD